MLKEHHEETSKLQLGKENGAKNFNENALVLALEHFIGEKKLDRGMRCATEDFNKLCQRVLPGYPDRSKIETRLRAMLDERYGKGDWLQSAN